VAVKSFVTRQLLPTFVERIWGSLTLEPLFQNPAASRIGEVWFPETMPGVSAPLLVKFIFTTENLSVQVHPGGPLGKTEMWHILKAEPGAAVAVGLKEPVDEATFRAACLSGEVEHLLSWVPVVPGDGVFVPAGTVHAIGAGITLCEVQQNNDVTYRLYDYGRPRELHLEAGLAVSALTRHPGVETVAGERLATSEYFEVDRCQVTGTRIVPAGYVVVLAGTGTVDGHPVRPGQVWTLDQPAAVEGTLEVIHARVPV
jgi:mannose-6-phosphate isomerase